MPAGGARDFAGERADLPLQLGRTLLAGWMPKRLDEVCDDVELPLVPVLVAMEQTGVRVDARALAAQSERFERELDARARRSSSWRARSSTSTRRSSSARSCSRSSSCRC